MEDRLKKFAQLVDAGSFVKASRQLHISQPALSVAIAKLERELHTPLLVHGVRPLVCTTAGELAYAAGKELLVQASNLQNQLAELAQRQVTVSVGMIDSIASLLFASVENVTQLERDASLSVVVDNSRVLLRRVEAAELDMAFVVAQPHYSSLLEVVRRYSEPLVLVCHPAEQKTVGEALHSGRLPRFISYDQASTTYRLVNDALRLNGVMTQPAFHSTSPEVMLRMVLLQKGVTVLPYQQVRSLLADGQLVLVSLPGLGTIERPIHAVQRRDTVLPAALMHTTRQAGQLLRTLQSEASTIVY